MTIRYLVDTDWVIDHLNQIERVVHRLRELRPQGLALSIVSLAELYKGVYYSRDPEQSQQALTALAHCPAGQMVTIRVSLTQDETAGEGVTISACTGGLAQYLVRVQAHGPHDFMPGPAQAEATARIRDHGTVVDTQEWTRAVTLESQ